MYNILVCDDEKDIVSALNIYLSAEGYRVLTAFDGPEALRLLDREEVHLVLLDVMMPGMDGITAMTRLRQSRNLPVILLTAKSEDTDKVLGLNMGADDYVTKPFNPVELLARVRSQLRRYMTLGGGHVAGWAVEAPRRRDHRRSEPGRQCQDRHRGRGHREPDAPGIRHSAASDAASGKGVLAPRDIPPGVARGPGGGQSCGRPCAAHPGEDRDQPRRAPVSEGGLGQGV